jgi:hypothetical protein
MERNTGRRPALRPDPPHNREVPRWAPPVLFGALTLWLFREFILSNQMLFGMDTLTLGYQARLFFSEALQTTGFPLWNPHILGGTPFIESLAGGDSLHPLSVLLFYLSEPYRALGWKLVIHVFLAGIFTYGWLRTLGLSREAAVVGGVGALLAPSFVTLVYPGHDGKMFVVAMTPLLFWLAEWSWHRRDLLPGALLSLSITLVIFSTHFQMAYFLFGALGLWMGIRAVEEGRARGWKVGARGYGVFLGFSLLGAGGAAIQLLPAVSYVTEFSRRATTTVEASSPEAARAYSSSWSLHPEEALSLVVPEFSGNSAGGAAWTTDTYWGRNAFKLNHEYLGVVLLGLALLAFLRTGQGSGRAAAEARGADGSRAPPGRPVVVWSLAGIGILATLFSLGAHTPIWRMAYEFLPGIALFRAPSMAIFLAAFALTTLAGIGIDRAREVLDAPGGLRRILIPTGTLATLLVVGWLLSVTGLLSALWTSTLYREIQPDRLDALARALPHISRGFLTAALLVGLLALFLTLAGRSRANTRWSLLWIGVVALVALDLTRVNSPFIQTIEPTRLTVPDANVRFLQGRLAQEPPFRVLSMLQGGQDVQPSAFGIDLAAGHHPNDLGRYRALIGMEGSGIPEWLARFHPNVMDLLNVRYVLWPDAQFGPLEGVEPISRIVLADGSSWASVYPYPGLPRARLVSQARVISDDADALRIILEDREFDPRDMTLLAEAPPFMPEARPDGTAHPLDAVTWLERTPDRIRLRVQASAPAILVVSQNWFPSWVARVDGVPVQVLRTDLTLQAVPVPAGTYEVELSVESAELQQALLLSGFSLVLTLLLGMGAPLIRGLRARPLRNE